MRIHKVDFLLKVEFLAVLLGFFLFSACSKEGSTQQNPADLIRLSMPEQGQLVWAAGDKVALVENYGETTQKSSIYEITEGQGQKVASFRYVSGDDIKDSFTKVLFPATALENPKVPKLQNSSDTFDRKALRLEWDYHEGQMNDIIGLENKTSLLTFRLSGHSEILTDISLKIGEETYSLKLPQVSLSDGPKSFHLVVPPMNIIDAEVLVKSQSNKSVFEMRGKLAPVNLKQGYSYNFPLTAFNPNLEIKELNLAFYNVSVFSRGLPADAMSEGHIPTVVAMMKEKKVDAMLLVELDKNNKRHGYDQLEVFANKMGWNYNFAKAFNYGGDLAHWNPEYGNGAAYDKKFKLVHTFNINFPKFGQEREDRVCLVVEFEDFVLSVVHMPLYAENSLKAAKELSEELKSRYLGKNKPVFLCGDMNSKPMDQTIVELKKDWKGISPEDYTCPTPTPTKCLDYIFALMNTGSYDVVYSEVCRDFRSADVNKISDHLPLYTKICYKRLISSDETPSYSLIENLW